MPSDGRAMPTRSDAPVRDFRQRRGQNRRRRLRKCFDAAEAAPPPRLCHAVARISDTAPDRLSANGGAETETAVQYDTTSGSQNDPKEKFASAIIPSQETPARTWYRSHRTG